MSKLLVLLAVLVMPLGMAPASATQQHTQSAASSMPMEHCPDPPPKQEQGASAQCTMACASTLPATGAATADVAMIVCSPQPPAAAQLLNSLHPETATPPPKRS